MGVGHERTQGGLPLPTRPAQRAYRWFALVACMFASWSSQAACLPLPDPELRGLDAEDLQDPEHVLNEAKHRLVQLTASTSALEQAELYALIAEANADIDRPDLSLAAITKGIELLDSAPDSESAKRVRLRLTLQRTELQSVAGDGVEAGAAIDRLLSGLAPDSLDRGCALSQRAIAYDFIGDAGNAVKTALPAYRLSVDHGWNILHVDSAYTLAVNYRRAGLYDQAAQMIDEVIAIETKIQMLRNLSDAYYERGQLMVAWGKPAEARTALALSKQYAVATGDRFDAAAADLPLCLAELNQHDLSAAQVTCGSGKADLIAGNRPDLATLWESHHARLDIELHDPAKAVAELNAILSRDIHRMLPTQESQIHRDRGRALGELHRYREAFADLSQALALDNAAAIERRDGQIAVLSTLIDAERLRTTNRLLEEMTKGQRRELDRQRQGRLLLTTLALALTAVCGLLASLLLLRRRHTQRLRRYDIILNHAWNQAPHAMLMLDENRLVCFANRPLLGEGSVPVAGASLADLAPPELLPAITAAIDRAFETNRFVDLDLVVREDDKDRYYELFVLPAMIEGKAIGVTLQSIDVTELRTVERQFIDGTFREREQLGGAIHEGLAQEMAGVLLMLSNLATRLKHGSTNCAHLVAEMAEHVARSISSARRMAQDLAPVTVERNSMRDALHRLTQSEVQRLGIPVSCECILEGCSLSRFAADHIYQLCRDSLSEAASMKSCSRIRFQLKVTSELLVIQMTGDYRGNPAPVEAGHDTSRKLIAFRARLLGGRVEFDRMPGIKESHIGITITIPLGQLQDRVASGSAWRAGEPPNQSSLHPPRASVTNSQ